LLVIAQVSRKGNPAVNDVDLAAPENRF